MPTFGRLDYQTRVGWVVGHAGTNLQDPQAYVNRLAKPRVVAGVERPGVVARFVPGDPGGPWEAPVLPPDVPAFEDVPEVVAVPIGSRIVECADCGHPHKVPWGCLL